MHARLIVLPNLATLGLAILGLAGCAQQSAGPTASRNPTYSVDLAGKAPECTAPAVELTPGHDTTGTIATGGGGWCGIAVTTSGNALTAGLLEQRPRNGHVHIHTVGDVTRVDYIPAAAAVAGDTFAVKFIPGDETMVVTVTGAGARK